MRALRDDGLRFVEKMPRIKAAEVLGRMGSAAKSAVPALRELLKVSDPDTRLQIAVALWTIDHRAEEAVGVLVSLLKDSATSSQRNALNPPGRFGLTSSTPPPPPCQLAAEALGQMGPAARAAVPALTEVMKVPQLSSYQAYYALALLKIDRHNAGLAVPALIEVLEGKGQVGLHSDQAA